MSTDCQLAAGLSILQAIFAMAVRRAAVLLLCALAVAYAQSEYEPVCNPTNYSLSPSPPIPQLPQQFSAVVEANIVQRNLTLLVREYFDEIGNRGRFEISSTRGNQLGIYDYNLGEIFLIPNRFTGDDCAVQLISQATRQLRVFGFEMVNGSVHIGTVSNFFQLAGNVSANYLGVEDVRGIPCNRWQTCVIRDSNNSYTIDYYFSTEEWNFAANPSGGPIPVQVILNGSRNADPLYSLYHVYTFLDFVSGPSSVPDEVFMVPTGLACRGRIPGQPLPTLPDFFSAYVEVVTPSQQTASVVREFYDYTHQLFRVDVNYDGRRGGSPGPLSVIHDFNNEVQYVIFRQFTNCSVQPIQRITGALLDATVDADGVPHLKSPVDLLLLSNQFNFSYEGVTNVRGVDVDSWISIRDFEQILSANLTDGLYELFFTRPGWRISNEVTVQTDPIPWRAKLSGVFSFINRTDNSTVSMNASSVFDLFGYSSDEPSFDVFDTSLCLPPSEYQIITIMIPGQENGLDLSRLRKAVRQSVSIYTGVQPLQVGSIEVVGENGSHIFVTFHIANLTSFATLPSGYQPQLANEAVELIILNLSPDGGLPFTITLNPSMTVTPIFFNVSQRCDVVPTAPPSTTTPMTTSPNTTTPMTTSPNTTTPSAMTSATSSVSTPPGTKPPSTTPPGTTPPGTTSPSTTPPGTTSPSTTPPTTLCSLGISTGAVAGIVILLFLVGVIVGGLAMLLLLCLVRMCRSRSTNISAVTYKRHEDEADIDG